MTTISQERAAHALREKNYTVAEIAKRLGVSEPTASRLLREPPCHPDAPAVISHLVMRGSRTVEEIANAAGLPLDTTAAAVRWLNTRGFLEIARYQDRGQHTVLYSIRVASTPGVL